jgi:hypothetical protein
MSSCNQRQDLEDGKVPMDISIFEYNDFNIAVRCIYETERLPTLNAVEVDPN